MCRKSVEDKTIEINAQLDRDRIKICPQKNFPLSFPYFRKKKKNEKRQTQLGKKLYEIWSEFYNLQIQKGFGPILFCTFSVEMKHER